MEWDGNGFVCNDLTGSAQNGSSHPPAAGASLTCFGVNGSATRLYFIDSANHVCEMEWDGNGFVCNDLTGSAQNGSSHPPAAGASLTCFGVNGSATRLYFVDSKNHLCEMAWEGNGFACNDVTGAAQNGSSRPAPGTFLTCFGVNGSATRVYYQDEIDTLYEVAWSGGWAVGPVG
jgi:hypothetical protein